MQTETGLILVPAVLSWTSGDEILPSKSITGYSLCFSPHYTHFVLVLQEQHPPHLMWSESCTSSSFI